jgi:2-keto-4-pentenoate hydratase/2-oxohepta-3-ene-1,7-dioic acid hydratase in catechol pathway
MKLVTYARGTGSRVGVVLTDGVHDAGFEGSMVELIEQWPERRDEVAAQAARGAVVDDPRLLAPLKPRSMRDFLAFEGHLVNAMKALGRPVAPEWYSVPAFYKGMPDTVAGPGDVVPWPYYATNLDHELELACVIGRRGKDIPRSEAMEHVFGYTIWNDFSARDVQTKELPVGMGPVLLTGDELDVYDLRMRVRVNGEQWGEDSSGSMYHKFDELIAYASMAQTLYPGELFGSGTAAGGSGVELGRSLAPGDVVELEIEGIGILRNRVGEAPGGD